MRVVRCCEACQPRATHATRAPLVMIMTQSNAVKLNFINYEHKFS